MSGERDVYIGEDLRAAAASAADRWEMLAAQAIHERGAFHVALAGGSTPRALYRLLAASPRRERIDWRAVRVWFGDERCVPPDHPDSNYRMAQETLLSHLPQPPSRVHRMRGEAEPMAAALEYEELLQRHLPRADRPLAPPRLDLILLGLGGDGHIASLFPGTAILDEESSLAAAVFVPQLSAWRISLTYPAIDAARQVMMLVTGADKAAIVAEAFGERAADYPVGRLRPAAGLEWHLDRAAAARLDGIDREIHGGIDA
jgi:6-phosphogluconolactonase